MTVAVVPVIVHGLGVKVAVRSLDPNVTVSVANEVGVPGEVSVTVAVHELVPLVVIVPGVQLTVTETLRTPTSIT